MLKLSLDGLKNRSAWEGAGVELPAYDLEKVRQNTHAAPIWVHFGAGNIARGFVAALQQNLLDRGLSQTGIIAVETYDEEIIDRIYAPYDSLSLLVIMLPDGTLKKKIISSMSDALVGAPDRKEDWARLVSIFENPSLQMASFTITEKGYALKGLSGDYFNDVKLDLEAGPDNPRHVMAKAAALAYRRFKKGRLPLAFVSMDNCSKNGKILHGSISEIAEKWVEKGLVEPAFLDYVNDPSLLSFPWSMIDKITPRPSDVVKAELEKLGIEGMDILCTSKKTYIAPYVNTEEPQYLAVEDLFPNGRPPLEKAGVMVADRETVERIEKMKVCTCLNPLHTALAVYGCLLGYNSIAGEMKDPELKKLVEEIGFTEGMPVVVHPGVLAPEDFIREVLEKRLPNPFIPDMPQRIVSDTSQKVGIRFGETIKAYAAKAPDGKVNLTYIPLAIAGWCRYLLGIDDEGKTFELSPDPMMNELKAVVDGIELGRGDGKKLKPLLSNERIFGLDLYSVGLGEKIEAYFNELTEGVHAVRKTLVKYLKA